MQRRDHNTVLWRVQWGIDGPLDAWDGLRFAYLTYSLIDCMHRMLQVALARRLFLPGYSSSSVRGDCAPKFHRLQWELQGSDCNYNATLHCIFDEHATWRFHMCHQRHLPIIRGTQCGVHETFDLRLDLAVRYYNRCELFRCYPIQHAPYVLQWNKYEAEGLGEVQRQLTQRNAWGGSDPLYRNGKLIEENSLR